MILGIKICSSVRFVDWIIQSIDIHVGQESLTRPGLKSIKYICKAQMPSYSGYPGLSKYMTYITFMKLLHLVFFY